MALATDEFFSWSGRASDGSHGNGHDRCIQARTTMALGNLFSIAAAYPTFCFPPDHPPPRHTPVLVALFQKWRRSSTAHEPSAALLSQAEFKRELARERIRSMRRSFPFCVLEIRLADHLGGRAAKRCRRVITAVLHRNVRLTDHKAQLQSDRFAVLFTDTPEMGGRSAMERLEGLLRSRDVSVTMRLEVFDPDGFGEDFPRDDYDSGDRFDSDDPPAGGRRRDDVSARRMSVAGSQATVVDEEERFSSATDVAVEPVAWHRVDGRVQVGRDLATGNLSMSGRFVKRSIDIAGASVGLIVGGPVILAAMAAIRWTDGKSPLFKQTREGYQGRPFTIYKLRTMVVDAESRQDELKDLSHRDGPAFKIADDPRVTRVGSFLRKTCLDELPQLWNVLKGEMSLVGPRPLPWHESRACDRWHRRRLDVRPGLTCYWQVEKDQVESFDDWMRMDLRYLERAGLWVDLGLIVRTVTVPIFGRGGH